MPKYKADSLDLLLPSFRVKVDILLQRMKDAGYDPIPFDTFRTAAESAKNARNGKGVVNSMHEYGAAVDIICGKTGWSNPKFFKELGKQAELLGLTWGGRFTRYDGPHVQAIPVKNQNQLRSLPESKRDEFVAKLLKDE
jgi:hypothetical protein